MRASHFVVMQRNFFQALGIIHIINPYLEFWTPNDVFEILKYECNCFLQLQISRCAETFVALLQSITNRYKGLSDVTLQLQFIQLQASKNAKAVTYWLHS